MLTAPATGSPLDLAGAARRVRGILRRSPKGAITAAHVRVRPASKHLRPRAGQPAARSRLGAGATGDGADFLLARAAEELGERLSLVKRRFALAADFGSPGPHGAVALAAGGRSIASPTRANLRQPRRRVLGRRRRPRAAAGGRGRFDLVVSLLALQTVNDLPGALIQMRRALKADGLFMAAILGGDTLTELRQSLTIAESEVLGGASPRVAPFVDVRALGSLAQRAGLALPVVDSTARPCATPTSSR